MSEYRTALITIDQIEETTALMQRTFDASLAPIFFLHPDSTIVVTYRGAVVAGLNLDIYRVNTRVTMGYLGWLYTDEAHRGKGLAGLLLCHALSFLAERGCTDVAGCVEGDNPASFKQLERAGFAPLSLGEQAKRFGLGIFTVWKRASRFFDMGYFLWHVRLDGQASKPYPEGTGALGRTALANIALMLPIVLGWNLPALLGMWSIGGRWSLLFAVLATLLVRDGAMCFVARGWRVTTRYTGWDTAYTLGIGAALFLGLPFPVPGNRYVTASKWSLSEHTVLLASMASASNLALTLLFVLFPNPYTLATLAVDSIPFFYPFCGFNASRLRRAGWRVWLLNLVLLLACTLTLRVY